MGDPFGIGPEVVVKALADPELRARARIVVYGMAEPMRLAAERARIAPYWQQGRAGVDGAEATVLVEQGETCGVRPGGRAEATAWGGEASFRFVEAAIASTRLPPDDPYRAEAIVTAPVSKQAWALAGHGAYAGHTELLAARFAAARTAMMFVSPKLRVVLATVHVPLMSLREVLTTERVLGAIELGEEACRLLGVAAPRIAVCGLNPHAGEGGLFGDEEQRVIEPALRRAVAVGIDVAGPFPGDTIFNAAVDGRYDLVVAMYHDQGLIPVKLLAWDQAVNVTLGLPTPRTSPDHGTAIDIAGRNRANPSSMIAAIALAIRLAVRRTKDERC